MWRGALLLGEASRLTPISPSPSLCRPHPQRHRLPRRHQRAPAPAQLPHLATRAGVECGGRFLGLPGPLPGTGVGMYEPVCVLRIPLASSLRKRMPVSCPGSCPLPLFLQQPLVCHIRLFSPPSKLPPSPSPTLGLQHLLARNSATGEIVTFSAQGGDSGLERRWRDGSLELDLPSQVWGRVWMA